MTSIVERNSVVFKLLPTIFSSLIESNDIIAFQSINQGQFYIHNGRIEATEVCTDSINTFLSSISFLFLSFSSERETETMIASVLCGQRIIVSFIFLSFNLHQAFLYDVFERKHGQRYLKFNGTINTNFAIESAFGVRVQCLHTK